MFFSLVKYFVFWLMYNLSILNCEEINIGLLYEEDNVDMEKIMSKAIEKANVEILQDIDQLTYTVAKIPDSNTYETSKRLCKMFRKDSGVAAVFGPMSRVAANHAMSICDAKEVPFIDGRWESGTAFPAINLHPHASQLAHALRDIVLLFDWEGFTILYESGPFIPIMNDLLELYDAKGYTVTLRKYDLDLQENFKHVLKRIKRSGENKIVIVGSIESLPELLKQAQQVGLITGHYQYIIANLDLQTLDLEPYQHSDTNITSIRIINPDDNTVKEIVEYLNENIEPTNVMLFPMTVSKALLYDGVFLLAETLKHSNIPTIFQPVPLNCNSDSTWEKGLSLVNFMKTTSIKGLTGEVKFDNQGLRTDFSIEVVELIPSGLTKIGVWSSSDGLQMDRGQPHFVQFDDRSLRNKSFIVLTALSDPYGMLKDSAAKLSGNDRFEGYGIDLIYELSQELGFNYTFQLQEDRIYGSYNRETNSWNGMIREIMDDRADLGITDLTMTSDRENAVDFTMPFMNLGISILYRKPTQEPPKLFSFMSPFSNQVWLYLGASYVGVSLSLFILGRLSPTEWDNPYPCIEEPTMLENQFSIRNSFWFTVGALLQQGSEIAPKAPSTRTVASIWWFFTLIMVSSYTANLAAFLTVVSLYSPVNSVEDLANQNGGVKYGAKRDGSTINFFKDAQDATYQRMWDFMKDHPELLTSSNDEGLTRVKNENYAFLMESTSIEYIVERNCEVTQIGSPLDEKGYGIAMKKNSPYRDALSQAMLRLQERGMLDKLKDKWWKEKRGGGACSDTGDDGGAVALELANLGGVFLLLAIGSVFGIFITILELIFDVRTRAIDLKVPFKEELVNEIKFVLKCSGNTKEVRRRKSSSSISKRSSLSVDSINSADSKDPKTVNGGHNIKSID